MKCAHIYVRRRWWLFLHPWNRWQCRKCGDLTRSYDTVDAWMTRPIHPHMSVAFPGFNTARRRRQ